VGDDQRVRRDNAVRSSDHDDRATRDAATVFVVDDEISVCVALSRLVRAAGFHVETFSSAGQLLQFGQIGSADCLVIDVHLPDLSGLELQARLSDMGIAIPIVFITARGDIPMSVRAMRAGALEFLTKPFDDDTLLEAIAKGVAMRRAGRRQEEERIDLRRRYAALTVRERDVMALVIRGRLNKQIAAELGIAEKTVKIHRGNVMRKMGAGSVPDLVRMADALGIRLPPPST
jgi:FixJ family two-component response regulator